MLYRTDDEKGLELSFKELLDNLKEIDWVRAGGFNVNIYRKLDEKNGEYQLVERVDNFNELFDEPKVYGLYTNDCPCCRIEYEVEKFSIDYFKKEIEAGIKPDM